MRRSLVFITLFGFVSAAFQIAGCSASAGDPDVTPVDTIHGDAAIGIGIDGSPVTTDGSIDSDVADSSIDAGPPPHFASFFAVPPGDGGSDPTLENKIIELVGRAVAGSDVRVSMYHWTSTAAAQAFVDASNRGVNVHVILDNEANALDGGDDDDPDPAASLNAASALLTSGLPAGALTLCTRGNGACIGNNINHNKIYMFSALDDGSTDVVVQSSANLTTNKLHNNLVVIRNDAALYDGYVTYFNDLTAQVENLNYYATVTGDHAIAYEFPRSSGDTVMTVLGNISCSPSSTSIVRVTMAFFTAARSAIATELVTLHNQGCDVRVNMRQAGTDVDQSIINTLTNGGVDVGLYPAAGGNDIHSKYLLIDAQYTTASTPTTQRQLVYTGSENYTGSALTQNDETLLRIDDPGVFADYRNNWATVRSQIK